MNKLYAYRGFLLALLAAFLLLLPGCPFPIIQGDFDFACVQSLSPVGVSIVLFVLSVLLRIQARRSIGEHTRGSVHAADELVTWGVYSKIRHPLYVSNTGVGISFALFHLGFSITALSFSVILVAYEIVLSRMEDSFLEGRFQDSWRSWKSVTPAFLPRLQNANKRTGNFPGGESAASCGGGRACRSFRDSLKADCSTWFWLCIFIALLVMRKVL